MAKPRRLAPVGNDDPIPALAQPRDRTTKPKPYRPSRAMQIAAERAKDHPRLRSMTSKVKE